MASCFVPAPLVEVTAPCRALCTPDAFSVVGQQTGSYGQEVLGVPSGTLTQHSCCPRYEDAGSCTPYRCGPAQLPRSRLAQSLALGTPSGKGAAR